MQTDYEEGEFEDEEFDEPMYFYCMCCNHTQDFVDDECDKCGACCMEPML